MNLTRWLFRHAYVPGWPKANTGDHLDIRNLNVVAITDEGVEFSCGGSWQVPQLLRLKRDLTIEVLESELEQIVASGFEFDEPDVPEWMRE